MTNANKPFEFFKPKHFFTLKVEGVAIEVHPHEAAYIAINANRMLNRWGKRIVGYERNDGELTLGRPKVLFDQAITMEGLLVCPRLIVKEDLECEHIKSSHIYFKEDDGYEPARLFHSFCPKGGEDLR